jgi:hypothetical protein
VFRSSIEPTLLARDQREIEQEERTTETAQLIHSTVVLRCLSCYSPVHPQYPDLAWHDSLFGGAGNRLVVWRRKCSEMSISARFE